MGRLEASRLGLWAAASLFCCCFHAALADTIIIEKVECSHAATGVDQWALNAAAAVGGLLAAFNKTTVGGVNLMKCPPGKDVKPGATLIEAGLATAKPAVGHLPPTYNGMYEQATCGASQGVAVLDWLNKKTSGTDDLIININGHQVLPPGGGHASIKAGETITPDADQVAFDFDGTCRIQLIEFDSGSDNDDLGFIDVKDDVSPGKDYQVKDALVSNKEEGDLYKVSYRVERNDKGKEKEAKYVQCGTAACRECAADDPCCKKASNKGLDRDGDKGDLKACPPGFTDRGFKTYDIVLFEDVHLRICGNKYAPGSTDSCNTYVPRGQTGTVAREEKRRMLMAALKRKIQQLLN